VSNIRKNTKEKTLLPMRMYHITDEDVQLISRVHHHTAVEICCVLNGEGEMDTPTGVYSFRRGSVFVFSPGERHCVTGYKAPTDMLILHFEPRYIWLADSGFSCTQLLDTFLNKSPLYTNFVPEHISEYVFSKIVEMEDELINLEAEYASALKLKLIEVLIYFLRHSGFASLSSMSESRKYNLENLRLSMEYIDNNLEKDLELEELAGRANMSKSYFCTVFKRYNGIKPWDYITIKRVDMALRLLPYMSEKKLNIAMDCGFNNTANFYRAFKKITGRTPGEYV